MLSYRTLLIVVTILSLSVTGLRQVRNSLSLTIGLMNACMWMLPIYERWKKKRDSHLLTGQSQLRVGNFAQAEQSLVLALAAAEEQHASEKKRAGILMSMAEAQRKQSKMGPAEQSIRLAMALVRAADLAPCLEIL